MPPSLTDHQGPAGWPNHAASKDGVSEALCAGDALEVVRELQVGAGDEVDDGLGDEYFGHSPREQCTSGR